MQEKREAEGMEKENGGIGSLDIKKMNKEELRSFAEALINENTEMEKELTAVKSERDKLSLSAKKAAELSAMYTSLTKDFEQYRKRNAEIEQSSKDNAVSEIVLKIVPVFDNIKIAIGQINEEKAKEGVTLIIRQFSEVLTAFGVSVINAEGEEFNPILHNALMAEETDDEELKGKVKQVFSDGYVLKDKVIKQSQVIVYK